MPTHTLFVLANGPDIRQFLHSGLADAFRENGSVTWAVSTSASCGELSGCDTVVQLSDVVGPLPRHLEIMRRVAERAFIARHTQRGGHAPWVNFFDTLRRRKTSPLKRIVDAVLGFTPVYLLLVKTERVMFTLTPIPNKARAFLHTLGVHVALLTEHETPTACALLWIARKCGIRTIVVANSWKDAYARSHVAVAPDVIVVPTTDAANHLRYANPGLKAHIIMQESLHTAQLTDPDRIEPREVFCCRYGLDPERPIACYTAAAPKAVHDEPQILMDLLTRLERSANSEQLLLRLNPMEDNPERWASVVEHFGVVVQMPEWLYIPTERWNAPSRADAAIWASTVAHCAFNISVPSTVTRDFQVFGKPVINIVFDAKDPKNPAESVRRYWDAPFYEVCQRNDLVNAAYSSDQLFRMVTQHYRSAYCEKYSMTINILPESLECLAELARRRSKS